MQVEDGVGASGFTEGNLQATAQSLTALMAERISAPMGLATVIDEARDRQVFIAAVGLPEPVATERETPLSHSFCRIVKATDAPLVVTDATADARVAGNPAIDDIGIQAYLGYPLRAATGEPLGAVCVLDRVPRRWTDSEQAHVRTVAEAINTQIGLRAALVAAEEARRQAEASNRALAEANRRFSDLADNVPGAIFRYTEHAGGRTEIEFMSPGCLSIWELPPEALYENAAPLWDMILPEDLPAMAASVRRSGEALIAWNHRWRIRTPSGKVKWLDGYGQPRRLDDRTVVWNSLILDVTRAVAAEQRSAETMRLLFEAGKQETIAAVAGGIAHDFNNLLMVVLGNAEALMEPDAQTDRDTLCQSIIKAAELGAELTKRLVSFARKADLHPDQVDVNAQVMDLRDVLRSVLPENIAFRVALSDDLPPVFVDRSFLESSLLNLALNARDAISGGGAITIETELVRVTDEFLQDRGEIAQTGPYVMVAVTDTGSGMTPDVMARIFEPFFSTKISTKGTGLGLPMVEGFVRQSGGLIRVYSEPGHGTSFRLYLPVLEGEPPGMETPAPLVRAHPGPATLLLVEDQADVRATLRTILQGDGHTVLEANSGDDGLAVFESDPDRIDAIVSDVVMPGRLQGPEMVLRIRALRPAVPVIYVSGYPHEANVHGNGIRRTDITLTKPVSRDALRAAVVRALRQKALPAGRA